MVSNNKRERATVENISSDSDIGKYVDQQALGSVDLLIEEIISRYNVSHSQVIRLLNEKLKEKNAISIPAALFQNRSLTIFELIVRFLHEIGKLSFKEISALLARDLKLVESKYLNSRIIPLDFGFKQSDVSIPSTIFRDRSLSFLEHITEHLKEVKRLRHSEIAHLLNRDTKTIWTIYMRAKEKRLRNVKLNLPI